MGRRSKFEASFKAKVALEAVKEQKTLNELAKEFKVSPSKIAAWKAEFLQNACAAFVKPDSSQERLVKHLNAEKAQLLKKVGELTIENDFFASGLRGCRTKSQIVELGKKLPHGMSNQPFFAGRCMYAEAASIMILKWNRRQI